jgi:hypothetical protein
MVRVCRSKAVVVGVLCERTRWGWSATSSFAESLHCWRVGSLRPADVDADVATLHPPERLELLAERSGTGLCLGVALGKPHQHSDARI